jgi:hypothetical protein
MDVVWQRQDVASPCAASVGNALKTSVVWVSLFSSSAGDHKNSFLISEKENRPFQSGLRNVFNVSQAYFATRIFLVKRFGPE